ncbi:MAG TPA: competence/damage-inducible protein A [Acidobacteriota bacterium]|nr:competence/damage-inducible protein A [Acidobacteriota bacterium]
MRAEIIAVGSELLSLERPETDSLFISSKLKTIGIEVLRKFVVGDREQELTEALSLALKHSDVVTITGGLGPTNDDMTREVVALFLGRELREDQKILDDLQRRYERFGLKLTPNNRRQAMVPDGAEVLPNPHGTAPGLFLKVADGLLFLLPGPPRELCPMVEKCVLPIIRRYKQVQPVPFRQLKVGGEAESRVDAKVESIYKEYQDVETTILSSPGVISLYFNWKGDPDLEAADQVLDELSDRVKKRLGRSVFSNREEELAEAVGRLLKDRSLTVATAESCTGGLIGKLLTDVAGSSAYYLGSIVSYSNSVKEKVLGVPRTLLETDGAVSESVARLMAIEVSGKLGSDVGLSVTGIAGPGGGTEEKPVGTIWLGLSIHDRTKTRSLFLPGRREAVRLRTSNLALDWLRREIL